MEAYIEGRSVRLVGIYSLNEAALIELLNMAGALQPSYIKSVIHYSGPY